MAGTQVRLAGEDAWELAEMLAFLLDWLAGRDQQLLQASLARFMDNEAYELASIRADLARFVLLLGGVDAERLIDGPEQEGLR